jgi:uncharacterized protein YjiS (DUF1127 family)
MITHDMQVGRSTFGHLRVLRASLVDWLRGCIERTRQRHALAALDSRLLQDVGLSRDDVASEVEKPFWQI